MAVSLYECVEELQIESADAEATLQSVGSSFTTVATNAPWLRLEEKMMPLSVTVDWYGPFGKTDGASQVSLWPSSEKLLYMALGSYNVYGYVGRTTRKNLNSRLSGHDHIEDDDDLYIGRVSTSGIPGPKPKRVPQDLDAAEHALIFVLKPKRNKNFMEKPPEDCVVVYSRTFDHPETRMPTIPTPKFPSLVVYDPSLQKPILLNRGELPYPR